MSSGMMLPTKRANSFVEKEKIKTSHNTIKQDVDKACIEIRLFFQKTPLQVIHSNIEKSIWLGEDSESDIFVARDVLGRKSLPLLKKDSNQSIYFCFSENIHGEIVNKSGTKTLLQQSIQSKTALRVEELSDVYQLPLEENHLYRLYIDENISLEVKRVLSPPIFTKTPKMDWSLFGYLTGSSLFHFLLLFLMFYIPPIANSLDMSQFETKNQFVKFSVKPPEAKEETIPAWLTNNKPHQTRKNANKHAGKEGKMGNAKNKTGRYAFKGPSDNLDPALARQKAEEAIMNTGVVGLIKGGGAQGSPFASVFGLDDAMGNAPENILGGLYGEKTQEADGEYGLGLKGTGFGGSGLDEKTIGLGSYKAFEGLEGRGFSSGSTCAGSFSAEKPLRKVAHVQKEKRTTGCAPYAHSRGYGSNIQSGKSIEQRKTRGPEVFQGTPKMLCGPPPTHACLDKEIIRRVVRRATPGIKFCYEKELQQNPTLAGTVAITFIIAPNGLVAQSTPKEGGVSNIVDTCVARKIKQLSFPVPKDMQGIVEVKYPFRFSTAGI